MYNTTAAGLPTWRKYVCIAQAVETLRVKDKRRIFQMMRHPGMHPDTFLPHIGLTLSEFAVFQVLADSQRRMQRP